MKQTMQQITEVEQEKWQKMMSSCRKACKILNTEYREPEYLNWSAGRKYHENLWTLVRRKK